MRGGEVVGVAGVEAMVKVNCSGAHATGDFVRAWFGSVVSGAPNALGFLGGCGVRPANAAKSRISVWLIPEDAYKPLAGESEENFHWDDNKSLTIRAWFVWQALKRDTF